MVVKDSGYAWVVLAASFLIQFAGIGFSIGGVPIMIMSFANEFPHEDKAKTSLIGSLRCVQFLASPLAVLMIKLRGCRITTLTGALLSAAGIALSALSTELWHVYLLYGIVGGIGIALTYTSSSAVISEYFDRKRNIAFPVACLGGGIGMLVFPYLLQLLLDHRGHQEALYYTAAFKTLELICGLFYRQNTNRAGNSSENGERSVQNMQSVFSNEVKHPVCTHNSAKRNGEAKSQADRAPSARTSLLCEANQVTTVNENPSDLLRSGQINDSTSLPKIVARKRRVSDLRRTLKPLGQWPCWCLSLNGFCWGFTVLATEMLLPTYMHERGVNKDKASLGLTLIGGGILASSLIVIVTGSVKYERLLVYSLTSAALGALTTLFTISSLYQVYLTLCSLYGLVLGVLLSLFMGALAEFGDLATFDDLFGMYILFNGAGELCGPIVIGTLQVSKGNEFGWYICGAVGTLGSLFALPLYLRRRHSM